ncbi:MAG: adenylosuccinate synthase [Calditrichaeota bacterium]|nr:adenylosuccinate synthase [Calditrichota bacterium]
MSVQIIVGAQWGDEGKGKVVDLLSEGADAVARYQGGANAGHTVVIGGKTYIFHLIPSGILHDGVICIIGNGVVFDPEAFERELSLLNENNIPYSGRLFLSAHAHVIMPYHKWLDANREKLQKFRIGTTGRGIGPAYVDKYDRLGIRIIDLFSPQVLREKIEMNLSLKKPFLGNQQINRDAIFRDYLKYGQRLEPFVEDTSILLNRLIAEGKNVLLEGAQGAMLDVDFGTYPFVTSSNPISGGACTGLGVAPTKIDRVLGVAKAYTTRVGEGPFPTEFKDAMADQIRNLGGEYGATTGRPRRCGWLDLVALKYAVRINGIDQLAITKLDVLDTLEELKICIAYECNGKTYQEYPLSPEVLKNCKPVYETVSGWKADTSQAKCLDDFPKNAKAYLDAISAFVGAGIRLVSVGAGRDQTVQINSAG